METKPRIILVVPPALKRVVERAAEQRGCSQGEIVRAALYENLKEYVVQDDVEKMEVKKLLNKTNFLKV